MRSPLPVEVVRSEESLELTWWPLDSMPESADFDVHLLAAQAAAYLART